MARLHIITGKGGVGKSSVAGALVVKLLEEKQGPVLLIDVQGSGRALQWLGLSGAPFENRPLGIIGGFGSRILPKETFRQYFGKMLALGREEGAFGAFTAGLRERVAEKVTENKIVSAFIDVCPGLEPAVLLGKIHWEASQGRTPNGDTPWSDVVVDAPATGHGLALFESTAALSEVFGRGLIFKQANEIMTFMRHSRRTRIWVVTLPEEVPVRETFELADGLEARGLKPAGIILNRRRPDLEGEGPAPKGAWAEEVGFERDRAEEQARLEAELESKLKGRLPLMKLPELAEPEGSLIVRGLAPCLRIAI